MIYCLCLLSFVATAFALELKDGVEPAKLPNIDFLGNGYDIIKGNPHTDLIDPGFRQQMFTFDYSKQTTSADGKWLIPNNVEMLPFTSCSYHSDTTEIRGTTSYQHILNVDAKIEAGYESPAFSAKFSVSTDYKSMEKKTTNEHHKFVSSVAKCVSYRAQIRQHLPFNLSDEFVEIVRNLPTTADTAASHPYADLIEEFGTHYLSTMIMGSKAVLNSEFDSNGWATEKSNSISIGVAASLSFRGFTAGASTLTTDEKTRAETFEKNRLDVHESYMGSRPVTGDWTEWAKASGDSPYPISYALLPITNLFQKRYFAGDDPTILNTKLALLNDSYWAYCGRLPGCDVPVPDPADVHTCLTKGDFIETTIIQCNNGCTVVSCSVEINFAIQSSLDVNIYRYHSGSLTRSSSSCECQHEENYAGICYALCSNIVNGRHFSTERIGQISTQTTGSYKCPPNSKVNKFCRCNTLFS